jgi:hypothetical protein
MLVFQAEVFAILACAHDIINHGTPEKHVSICSDSLAALKALGAVRTTSPLVRQCQEALNDISATHAVGLYWVPGHTGVRGNETADGLARSGSASGFVGPEPALGVSKRDFSSKIGRWLVNKHQRRWRDLGEFPTTGSGVDLGAPGRNSYPPVGNNPGWLPDSLPA